MTSSRRIALNLAGADDLAPGRGFAALLDAAQTADALGVDLLVMADHLTLSAREHAEREGFSYPLELAWYEPIAALAAIAAVTRSARLGTSVLVAPLRPPLLLAKQIATLDAISGGRVEIALGAGWQQTEFAANGSEFTGRFGAMDEQIRVCRALWAGAPARHDGPRWPFDDLHSLPLPHQGAALPIIIGGRLTNATMGRLVDLADGWAPMPSSLDELRGDIPRLHEALRAADRDPDSFRITAIAPLLPHGTRAEEAGTAHPLAFAEEAWAAGADTVLVHPHAFCSGLDDLRGFLAPLLRAR